MTTRRFGARYGKRVRDRLRTIERTDSKSQLCPYCRKPKVKRLSLGIFQCNKCKAKFTGKAYSLRKRKIKTKTQSDITLDEVSEEIIEKPDEEVKEDNKIMNE